MIKPISASLENLIKRASARLQALAYDEAEALYTQALEKRKDIPTALLGLAMVFNRTQRSAQALPLLQKVWATVQAPHSQVGKVARAEILAQLGLALHQTGQTVQALSCFKQAYKLNPSSALQDLIHQLGEPVTPQTPEQQMLQYAAQAIQQGQPIEAVKACKAALQLNPDSDVALHLLGDLLRQQGMLTEALSLIQQAIVLQPEVSEYPNTLGMLFMQKGDFAKAVMFHQRALKINPNNVAAQSNLGVALKRLGRVDEAAHAYERALQLNPDMPEVHNNLGNLQWQLGQLEAARVSLERALQLRPEYPDARTNLEGLLQAINASKAKVETSTSAAEDDALEEPVSRSDRALTSGAAPSQAKVTLPSASKPARSAAKSVRHVTTKTTSPTVEEVNAGVSDVIRADAAAAKGLPVAALASKRRPSTKPSRTQSTRPLSNGNDPQRGKTDEQGDAAQEVPVASVPNKPAKPTRRVKSLSAAQ